jgi:hypothetical protein
MTYADALLLLFEWADIADRRFPPAAARWHAKFVLKAGLTLGEAEAAMNLLLGIRGANRHIARRRLLVMVERAGLTTRDVEHA